MTISKEVLKFTHPSLTRPLYLTIPAANFKPRYLDQYNPVTSVLVRIKIISK